MPPVQGYGPPAQGYDAPAQGYGAPAPGYGPQPGAPHTPQGSGHYTFPSLERPQLDPLAPVSILTAPLAPLGLGLGIASLRRTRENRLRGRGMAITGTILSSFFLASLLLLVATFALDGTFARMVESPIAGDVPTAQGVAAVNLDVGNCVTTLPVTSEVGEITRAPCAEEHQFQVLDRVPVPGDAYPGSQELFAEADGVCRAAFESISAGDPLWAESYEPRSLVPSPENWEAGERNIICLLRSTTGAVTVDLVNG